MAPRPQQTQTSGIATGGPLLGAAKLYFLVAAYCTTLALTYLVDPATMGQYSVVARLIAVPNMVIIQTLLFAVSRPLAAEHDSGFQSYAALRSRGMLLSAILGGGACIVFFVGAPVFAAWLKDPELVLPIRVVAPISAFYAFYAINVGTLNATRRFSWQAGLDVFMATAKAGLIVAAAAAGFGLALTVAGFTVASLLALCLSVVFVMVKRPPTTRGEGGAAPPMAAFATILILFTAATNLLLLVDLAVLKRFASDEAREAAVGFYASAQMVALVPYSLLNAVALVMFPLIATLAAANDHARIRRYVTETAKVCVLALCLMSAVGSVAAPEIQALLFPSAYGSAATDLRYLVWGYSGYSLTITCAWILNSARHSIVAIVLVGTVTVLVSILCFVFIPMWGDVGAARAVAISGGVGAVGALVALGWVFDAKIPLVFAAKVALGVVLVTAAGRLWIPGSKLLILVELTALTLLFVGTVVATRAVTWSDLQRLRNKEEGLTARDEGEKEKGDNGS